MKVAFYTLGCKVNQYETEAMRSMFESHRYEVVPFEEYADVYVINTCTVTNLGDRKSRQMIRRARKNNADAIIAVVGCYAQTAAEEVSSIEGVNIIIGTKDRTRIIALIEQIQDKGQQINAVQDIMQAKDFEDLQISTFKDKTRAFLKIQEGCNQFCSYCIIPYARGPIRSRKPADVLTEVQKLTDAGFKEVVFTGIHIASYGKDIGDIHLIDLIEEVHQVSGIARIRLGSIEPTLITQEFIERALKLPRLCPHYHISLQSGSDDTLKRMNRKYTTTQYKQVVQMLRESFEDVGITTDMMVGFPGETEQEFKESLQFVENIKFSQVHVFKYSARKGTPAATFEHQVLASEKENRSKRMIEVAKCNERVFYQKHINTYMLVLFEQHFNNEEDMYEGLTPNYIRVVVKSSESLAGKLCKIKLSRIEEGYLVGEMVEM